MANHIVFRVIGFSAIVFFSGCLSDSDPELSQAEPLLIGNWMQVEGNPDSAASFMSFDSAQVTVLNGRRNCLSKQQVEPYGYSGDTLRIGDTAMVFQGAFSANGDTLFLSRHDTAGEASKYVRVENLDASEVTSDRTLRSSLDWSNGSGAEPEMVRFGDSIHAEVRFELDSPGAAKYSYALIIHILEKGAEGNPLDSLPLRVRSGSAGFGFNTGALSLTEGMLDSGITLGLEIAEIDCQGLAHPVSREIRKSYRFRVPGDSSSLRFRDFRDYQVFQRDAAKKNARISLEGTVGREVASLAYRIFLDSTGNCISAWKNLTLSLRAFRDSVRVGQGGWYRIQYRTTNASGHKSVSLSRKFGVGMNILCIGQSNMSGRGGHSGYKTAPDMIALYRNDSGWSHLTEPFDGGGIPGRVDDDGKNPGYSMIPALTTRLADLGFPIGIIPACKGSTGMYDSVMQLPWSSHTWSFRNPLNHKDPGTLYGNSLSKIDSVEGVEMILMIQGEHDVGVGYQNYKMAFESMLAHYREDLGATIPVFYSELGSSAPVTQGPDYQDVAKAQRDVADDRDYFLIAPTSDLEVNPSEPDHYTSQSLDLLGERFAKRILLYLGGK